jgi:hypothetical protein
MAGRAQISAMKGSKLERGLTTYVIPSASSAYGYPRKERKNVARARYAL